MKEKLNSLQIDLSALQIEDIEVFFQEGSKGMAAFAASSSGTNCSAANACSSKQQVTPAGGGGA
jgi:hypothetical protein